jgi:hypothetical protein
MWGTRVWQVLGFTAKIQKHEEEKNPQEIHGQNLHK